MKTVKQLAKELDELWPGWRSTVSPDPVEAAVELSIIEPEEAENEDYRPLDFND